MAAKSYHGGPAGPRCPSRRPRSLAARRGSREHAAMNVPEPSPVLAITSGATATGVATPAVEELDVSVVIPVLNEEDGIERCQSELTRVLEAAKLRYELVYVDDGSTDGSLAKMKAFAEKDR